MIPKGGGLLGGLTAFEIRMLCENTWEGGRGFTPSEVGQMTLDQIWMQLCKRDYLKREIGSRSITMEASEVASSISPDKDGFYKVVTTSGKVVKMQRGKKSVARQLMEKEKEKQQSQKKRRRRHGT